MTFDEYLQLLDEYWEMFGPIPEVNPYPDRFLIIKL
jgi:hypothetical protein